MFCRVFCLLVAAVALCPAQLTTDQKVADFNQLAALYAKQYAPYEWKQTLFQFDVLSIGQWLDRVRATTDDLSFWDLCFEYISNFRDGHTTFSLPSSFVASLGFSVDLYEGKTLIASVTRSRLPAAQYPFVAGDELISIDGVATADLISKYSRYYPSGHPLASQRLTASTALSYRYQSDLPSAPFDIADNATVVIQRQNGDVETYTIPWVKTGVPITSIDPVPSPHAVVAHNVADETTPDYLQGLKELQVSGYAGRGTDGILNWGISAPVYTLPVGFKQRLGAKAGDFYLSGTFPANGLTFGYIRIPNFDPVQNSGISQATALSLFATEIAYMDANTDGLILDTTRNTGGQLCFGESLLGYLMPNGFHAMGYELRATQLYVNRFNSLLLSAKAANAPQSVIDQYTTLLQAVEGAYAANRGRTAPVPLCGGTLDIAPKLDAKGNNVAYTKPIVTMIDEFSVSTADMFAAVLQDNQRALLVGKRTNGMGGTVLTYDENNAMTYSEANTRCTAGLMSRMNPVSTPDYPASNYVENIGVRPDIEIELMTQVNLVQSGRPYFNAVVAAATDYINKGKSVSGVAQARY